MKFGVLNKIFLDIKKITIDGEWGCGKTWVLNELEKQLAEDLENKYLIFHYNACGMRAASISMNLSITH